MANQLKKVSQCISEQIPHQKNKVHGGDLLTKSLSKINLNENVFIPASMDYDHEMVPKSKDWVKRLNPDSKLPNFNTGRILVPKNQAVNESLKPTEASTDPESSKASEAESLTPLPPLKILQGASPSSEVMSLTFQPHSPKERSGLGTVTVSEIEPTTTSVPTEVKNTEQELNINELTKLDQMLIDKKDLKYEMYTALLKRSENYKAQPYQYASPSKQILKAKAKPFSPCTHCGFNDHRPDDCRNYPNVMHVEALYTPPLTTMNPITLKERHIKEPIWYLDSGYSRSMTGVKSYLHKYVEQPGPKKPRPLFLSDGPKNPVQRPQINHLGKFDAKAGDGYLLGYSFNSKAFRVFKTRRQQIEETYHVIFDESMEAIRFTNTSVNEIGIDNSSIYPPDEYHHEDDPYRKYQSNFDISCYIIPHGRSLTKLAQEKHVPEGIALNEPDIPHTEDAEGPPDLINTKGTHEQNDRWSKDQHIELVNIIGDPGEGMLTRSMDPKLTAASASKYLFADFLSKIYPKKVSETLKHPGWVDAMQEELNQFYRNKAWTLVPPLHEK
ncbi:retrovirus-related pol polyprotein from transposon TNT 1-94 [Tanacetum coccineum]|uniref:Retrovirus-related pol polyprotein from transposon TNT 1-94 n=1 Tax=Tanacetum coccineum TaxID=301880 RepID=A0ABQ5FS42_9ASTR